MERDRRALRPSGAARWGSVLFFSGGLLAALFLLVPNGPIRNEAMALADALAAMAVGVLLYFLGSRVHGWMLHALMLVGALQVAVGMQFLGRGPASVTATGFYVWVAIFAAHFFPWRATVAHLLAMAGFLAASLWALHEPAGPGIWLIAIGTAGVAAAVVGGLSHQLRLAAGSDGLTGLPNRWNWEDALERELHRARRTGGSFCVAAIDLDDFKSLNDTRGHQAGDLYLRELAAAWSGAIRGHDLLARYGGDEFALLLPDATREQALVIIERMRAVAPEATFCSGVAEWDRGESAKALLERADIAVYRAKAEGGNATIVAGSGQSG